MAEDTDKNRLNGMEFLQDLPSGIMIVEREGRIETLNSEMERLLGSSADSVEGSMLYDMVDPSDIPPLLEIIKKPKKRKARRLDLNFTLEKNVLLSGSFSWSGRGDSRRLICSFIPRKGTEDSKFISRKVFEELPFPVTILNKRLEPVFQNSSTDEQISLVAKRRDPIKYPKKDLKGLLMKALTEGKGGTIQVNVPVKDGSRDFEVIVTPIYHGKEPDQVMEIWMDETPLVGEEMEGIIPHGFSDELIENSNAIIIGIDMEGRIKLFNNGARRTLGYEPSQVEGNIWFDYLVDKDAEEGKLEVFQWNIGSGFRTQYESRVRAESGKIITILLENTIIFNRKGEVSLVLMVGQDITRTKKLEQTMKEQSEKLADAMEELTLYNDLMIHDIHNANAGILGYLELLTMDAIPDSKKKDYIRRALSEVKKSSSIIKDVKVMSQSKPDRTPHAMDLDDAIMSSMRRIKENAGTENITIDWEGTDIHVMADDVLEEAFLRVLENSFSNSRTHDLRVRVDVKRDPSKSNVIPEPVHITFTDNGGEISEDMKNALLEKPSSTEWGSHMLGLYLVKKIIGNYNGLVWIERIEGGTRVHLILSEAV